VTVPRNYVTWSVGAGLQDYPCLWFGHVADSEYTIQGWSLTGRKELWLCILRSELISFPFGKRKWKWSRIRSIEVSTLPMVSSSISRVMIMQYLHRSLEMLASTIGHSYAGSSRTRGADPFIRGTFSSNLRAYYSTYKSNKLSRCNCATSHENSAQHWHESLLTREAHADCCSPELVNNFKFLRSLIAMV